MTGLAELQSRFAASVTGDPTSVLPMLADDGRQSDRFEIHRNNTFASLKSVLEEAFPTVAAVLGQEMFQRLSAAFVRNHPPRINHLLDYGGELPGFIGRSEPLAQWPWLGDAAALDWAVNAAYGARDAEPLAPDDLAALPPEQLVETQLPLLPSAALLRSDWPVHAIWMYPGEAVDVRPRGEAVLVIRPGVEVMALPLDPAEFAFLEALAAGHPLGQAAAAGQAADPGFDIQGVLARHLAGGHFARTPSSHKEGEQG